MLYFVLMCKGSFGGCQGQPSARPWHLLIRSLGLAALPPPSVRLCTRGIAYPTLYYIVLFYQLLCDIYSACLLPTVHPGNTPYIYRYFSSCLTIYLCLTFYYRSLELYIKYRHYTFNLK